MKTDPNDPINPAEISFNEGRRQEGHQTGNNLYTIYGLTKREYFAAMAMQGMLASPYLGNSPLTETSVMYADHLIEELNKEQEGKQ